MTIKATGVPSYTSFYADVDGQLFEQPIQHNGKYKFVLKDDGPFATGLMPQFMRDQSSNSYDIYINIPNNTSDLPENIATLQITDAVLDSVLQLENGILNLPSSLPALNTATHFNTNGKDYATGVSIDLTNLTYYSSMPEIDNGNYGNVIPVNENNVEITLLDDNNDKTDVEHTITPYNPNTNKRSIKAVNLTKDGNMRDVTAKDIVGYIRVNIPPPSISSTISTNGYYNFNSNWDGLIQGTDQDYELNIQVPNTTETLTATQNNHIYTPTEGTIGFSSVNVQVQPLLQNKTVTIDSIESNQSTVIEKTGDYVSLIPTLGSNIYNNGEIEVGGSLGTDTYKLFDGNTSDNIDTTNKNVDIKFSSPKKVEKLWVQVGDGGSWRTHNQYTLYGCDNDQFTNLIQLYQSGVVGSYTVIDQVINNENSYKYYRIRITAPGYDAFSETREIRLFEYQSQFDGLNKITIINNTDSKIYKGYNNNNKYSITQTGDGTITIPTDYQALGEIKYNVNVPTTLVDNADVDSQNNNVISTNGTFTIPSGKTGWNSFSVNVPQSQQTKINFKYVKAGEQTVSLSELTYTQREEDIVLLSNKIIFYMKKIESDSWMLNLYKNGNSSRDFYLSNGYYYHIFNDEIIYLCDNNLNNIGGFYDPSNDAAATTFYLYENCFNLIFN